MLSKNKLGLPVKEVKKNFYDPVSLKAKQDDGEKSQEDIELDDQIEQLRKKKFI